MGVNGGRFRTVLLTVTALLAALGCVSASPAGAEPGSRVIDRYVDDPQQTTLLVHSAAMDRSVAVTVLTPRDRSRPAPVLYLLNGAGGGEDSATWDARTTYKKYFADKNAYVVTPIGGAFSYYTDWQRDDPVLGRNKWQTFLTEELPPIIDEEFPTTGANAIAGISMAGTSVLNLAIAAPGLYRSVAAFSGCARTSDPAGQQYIRMVVEDRGGANMVNMWGPLSGPGWRANDPYLNAEKLRGTKVYMTSGTGLPGSHERLGDPSIDGSAFDLVNQAVVGGGIEVAIDICTRQMVQRMRALGLPVQVNLRPTGTHSWGYWQDDLYATWPKLARDLR
ncbi:MULTISPECIES: alpha/beta hydrolase [Gordonia]|uniref:Esterase n=1 Tax=Gordonia alkanivorans CGMCC 6845 TaxID=1423140 RepID=W9DEH4_9ACTN|nr:MULTISPECIES: alpha/beta hydrolase family protein [Gordonia]ETA06832.1 esterase [Gordonia alkanivorans CGMCC 6845]MDH3007314.1 alpha/beta hydrolase family protein [Gordonia alkanivorans]MDH3016255.1 alpha/beta hydrolase family protein [Gordonia alkanivorans]MDH3019505.1 alpha/beta hydrolase family protein [Gordonia alkanivorans]MDH3041095.1 alpha/beta hydrolase family protein [Gordonia alkanivorans]